jgi:hypothetical protein
MPRIVVASEIVKSDFAPLWRDAAILRGHVLGKERSVGAQGAVVLDLDASIAIGRR